MLGIGCIWSIVTRGRVGESYNIGGLCEMKNIDVVKLLCEIVAQKTNVSVEQCLQLITYVKDRPGHDWRYAIDCSKIQKELDWNPTVTFAQGIEKTVDWYLQNSDWVNSVRSGEYRQWIDKNYMLRN
jgi:dTDP-glucose 4,6-dehydratase